MNSEFDWSKVKVRQVGGKPPKPKRGKFVSVPYDWVEKLSNTKRVSTFKVALLLLWEEWKSPGEPVRLSNMRLVRFGVSRDQKAKALAELAHLGLAEIEGGKSRQSPLVKLKREESRD
jgi:hypothetical protein